MVATGAIALALLEQESFDLVLMDLEMPNVDGVATTALIRAKEEFTGNHLPIIAMTAQAMEKEAERCFAAGLDGSVAKPVEVEKLYHAIDQLIADTSAPARSQRASLVALAE